MERESDERIRQNTIRHGIPEFEHVEEKRLKDNAVVYAARTTDGEYVRHNSDIVFPLMIASNCAEMFEDLNFAKLHIVVKDEDLDDDITMSTEWKIKSEQFSFLLITNMRSQQNHTVEFAPDPILRNT